MILIVLAALLVAGIFLAWSTGSWWMPGGTIAMAIGSMFNPDIPGNAATNLFELISSLAVTKVKLENRSTRSADTDIPVQEWPQGTVGNRVGRTAFPGTARFILAASLFSIFQAHPTSPIASGIRPQYGR